MNYWNKLRELEYEWIEVNINNNEYFKVLKELNNKENIISDLQDFINCNEDYASARRLLDVLEEKLEEQKECDLEAAMELTCLEF